MTVTIEYDNLLVASHDMLCLIIIGFIEANHNRTVVHLYFIFGTKFLVEKILKGSLDSIQSPSPSVKIQIIGGKVYLM